MRRALITLAVLSGLVVLSPRADATPADVTIQGFAFHPPSVTIAEGESVTWTNKDSVAHTATADDGSFDTSPTCDSSHTEDESCLKPDAPFFVTFSSPGTYAYHCKIHPTMHGTVIVTSTTTEPPTTEPPTTEPPATTTATSSSSSSALTSSSTTTTSSSTTTTSTSSTTTSSSTTTTLFSSASAPITVNDKPSSSGGSSAVPWLLGGAAVVAGLAALAYWLWWRSGEPVDDGPDWTQEPPPTTQGPRI